MTDRHLSNRFERGTRERRLLRSFEDGFQGNIFNSIAMIDINTQHELVLFCANEQMMDHSWAIWQQCQDPDGWEDDVISYASYEEAQKAFDEWSDRPLEPNWEAQAEYDELHGTINGEDAGIVMMRELWGE
jgi:hypothetical protein